LAAVSPINLTQSNRFALLPNAARSEHLLVRTEGDSGIVHQLGKRTTIGRKNDNDLQIEEDFISRHHALILVGERETVIEDLNSANGVYVNGTRIARKELREGDLVTIGKTEYRYVLKPATERSN
jgi:pSer/pThr/pTyr-binding forkhead associated (FHA) protein